jgi:hypothetical protein
VVLDIAQGTSHGVEEEPGARHCTRHLPQGRGRTRDDTGYGALRLHTTNFIPGAPVKEETITFLSTMKGIPKIKEMTFHFRRAGNKSY